MREKKAPSSSGWLIGRASVRDTDEGEVFELHVGDTELTLDFFVNFLDFEMRTVEHGKGEKMVAVAPCGSEHALVLVGPSHENWREYTVGADTGLVFCARDLLEAAEELEFRGVSYEFEREGLRFFDPDNNLYHLVELR